MAFCCRKIITKSQVKLYITLKFYKMEDQIIVTTGIYDVIKDHLRRKRTTIQEEEILVNQLKNARQVLRKELPEDIVTVNRKVLIKDHATNEEQEYIFVSTNRAKPKKNKYSILSNMALATVGMPVGSVIEWPFPEGDKKIEILKVEPFEQL